MRSPRRRGQRYGVIGCRVRSEASVGGLTFRAVNAQRSAPTCICAGAITSSAIVSVVRASAAKPRARWPKSRTGFIAELLTVRDKLVSLVAQDSGNKRLVLDVMVSYTYQRVAPAPQRVARVPRRRRGSEPPRGGRRAAPHSQRS